ncbi:hypothetical protein [Nocardiopsis synnemataformans]|uniref:hypothetical protein n=1 Tax=Nocardiopsis synnemataformans TaxID=61305 RepID=UPI003EBEB3B7
MNPSRIVQVSATGDVVTTSAYLRELVVTAAEAAATVEVRAGGAAGATVLTVAAAAGATASAEVTDALCSGGIHLTLVGAGALATVTFA